MYKNGVEAFVVVSERILNKEISLEEGWAEWERLYQEPYCKDLKSLLRRADWNARRKENERGRTLVEFHNWMKEHTLKQAPLMLEFANSLEKAGHTIEFRDRGVGPNGELITHADPDLPNEDYYVTIDDVDDILELKPCKVDYISTFKTADLRNYISKGSLILLILNSEQVDKKWALFGPDTMRSLLTLKKFAFDKFGGKECVQIGPYARFGPVPFEKVFELHRMCDCSTYTTPSNCFINLQE